MTATDMRPRAPGGKFAPVVPATVSVPPELAAALIRVVQAAVLPLAAALGRAEGGANSTLVRLGAAREDVETLRAFLAAQPGFPSGPDG